MMKENLLTPDLKNEKLSANPAKKAFCRGLFSFGIILVFILGAGLAFQKRRGSLLKKIPDQRSSSSPSISLKTPGGMVKFDSSADFSGYLAKAQEIAEGWSNFSFSQEEVYFGEGLKIGEEVRSAPEPGRFSETTVQVPGIDEPDILKTNGQKIFFSSPAGFYPLEKSNAPVLTEEVFFPFRAETKVIQAFPPADLAEIGQIKRSGELLLEQDTLLVLDRTEIYGFDISLSDLPREKWQLELAENGELITARLFEGDLYLIVRQRIDPSSPCPVRFFSNDSSWPEVACRDIYRPEAIVPINVVYAALKIDPQTGQTEESLSFTGTLSSTVVYASPQSIYLTYGIEAEPVKLLALFFQEEGRGLLPGSILDKINRLQTYEISSLAKMTEFNLILKQYKASLIRDEQVRFEAEMNNRLADFTGKHQRELRRTGLIRIGLSSFKLEASGEVPGQVLNQFSLDEYEGNLRIATTIGQSGGWLIRNQGESANSVYILDRNLKILGSVEDLGLGERVYSARFLGNRGYVVTFKKIDPFYVLDLSDPRRPLLKGELKIPGFSSYLHPLSEDKILGIGQEDSGVKISLFDVTSAENPQELDKYLLDEHWSEVLSSYHAFLFDEKHQVFFLPASKGGYIFSYRDDKLVLVKVLTGVQARRAVYINDYFYVVGDNQIAVLSENNWEKISQLDF
ncbi:MAG: beta-propeller domain-containing protein [Candidatus Pacebacteria bacterium]|nr:beta-propeller domain-containing protein [Candidatus Paceibacterota bacterium]